MSEPSLKKKVLSNLFWRFGERFGARLVSFCVSIVLARLLTPEDYGTVALITVFITLLQVFIDSGLGNALIQKKDADDIDFSTVFYTNMTFCVVLYLLMFVSAPAIARFYGNEAMIPMIRVLCLLLIISGIKNVQQAYVSRKLLFKKFFFATLGGTIGAAVLGIWMAMKGYGVWALIAQQLFNSTLDTLILSLTVGFRPIKAFSFQRLRIMYSYSWKLLASSVLDTAYGNLRHLIIGRVYSSADLGNFNRGEQFPNLIVSNINSSIDSVLLPVMSREQDDRDRVRQMTRTAIKTSMFVMAPLMIGLAVVAPQLVEVLLTQKWMPCIPFLQLFCVIYLFYPVHTANLNAMKALGRSDIFLKLEIIKKIIGLAVLLPVIHKGPLAITWSMVGASFLAMAINAWPNRKLLHYRYLEQLRDILPELALAAFMGGVVYGVGMLPIMTVIKLVLQIICGALIYIAGGTLLHFESMDRMKKLLKKRKK